MSRYDLSTFKGRRVFLTGHTGFKGSWLAIWLARLGARITGYSLAPPTSPSNFVASGVESLLKAHIEADLRDRNRLQSAIAESEPEALFHLAAQPIVRESFANPLETIDVNVGGTAAVLDAIRKQARPCVVIVITSDKCYNNEEQVWGYREMDPMGGKDPYSASKGAAELVVSAYRNSFFHLERLLEHGVKLATARAGNVIGGGDWAADRIVPDLVRAFSQDESVGVRNPRAVRPWQHVLEPLSGYLLLAAQMLTRDDAVLCSPWNFGPRTGDTRSVRELVERCCAMWGEGKWHDASKAEGPPESQALRISIDKAVSLLGWQPCWALDRCVERTISWYRDFLETPEDMRGRCEADIAAYEAGVLDNS